MKFRVFKSFLPGIILLLSTLISSSLVNGQVNVLFCTHNTPTQDRITVVLDNIVDFAPDAGHIAKGGMDAVAIFRQYRSRIRHIHFKDMDSNQNWVEMGQGIIDYKTIVEDLSKTDYYGWIMIEDESARAEDDPDGVTIENGKYLAGVGLLQP